MTKPDNTATIPDIIIPYPNIGQKPVKMKKTSIAIGENANILTTMPILYICLVPCHRRGVLVPNSEALCHRGEFLGPNSESG